MNGNLLNIDETIKRIYSLYIDIKTKEFDELKKDIMMDDIKNLYVMIKSLGTQNESIINEKHKEILNDIEIIGIDINSEDAPTNEVTKSIIVQEVNNSDLKTEIKNLDLTFDFSNGEEDTTFEIRKENKDENIEEVISNIDETSDTKNSIISSGAIQDYLNKDEAPKKEIYDFLDLNTRIGLVEKFFKGNSIDLSECLMKMNSKNSKIECIEILKNYQTKYGIDNKEEIYQTFMELLDRKYN
jgi:hypothetical protein